MSEELNDKLRSVLNDPESLSKIAETMSALGYGGTDINANKQNYVKGDSEQDETELTMKNTVSKTDDRIKLLASLRPFLEPTKQQKVDSLIKALGAAKLISRYKGDDLFGLFGTR